MRLYLSSFRLGNKPERLLELIGSGRRTALVGNAVDFLGTSERAASMASEAERLKSIGLDPKEVDLRAYFGKPEALKEKLAEFDLVWVRGGNSFLLRRAFKQSGADEAMPELLRENKIVYGGYSAGIVVLTPSLRGIELVDPKDEIAEGYKEEVIWDGLGLLNYAIAPHYKSDYPESKAVDTCVSYMIDHHLPFVALRDGEVIIIEGNSREVVS